MKRADLVIDVSDSNGPAVTLQSAVSVYAPDKISAGRTIVVFAFPGGGFSRHYYDIHLETGARYSQVEHHVNHGLIVVTVDYLGTGGSVFPDLDLLDLEVVGLGAQTTVKKVLAFLSKENELAIGPLESPIAVGIGHSLGGLLLTFVQAWYETFDAVVFLGWSSIQAVLPRPQPHTKDLARMEPPRGTDFATSRAFAARRTVWAVGPHGRGLWHHHYWDDLLPEIVERDRTESPLPPWRSTTIPSFALWGLSKGVVSEEARVISVPVLIVNGEIDTSRDPLAEPSSYTQSPCVTTIVIDRMAHLHIFAATREGMWNRITTWISFVLLSGS